MDIWGYLWLLNNIALLVDNSQCGNPFDYNKVADKQEYNAN
jgi:hypothetical protein